MFRGHRPNPPWLPHVTHSPKEIADLIKEILSQKTLMVFITPVDNVSYFPANTWWHGHSLFPHDFWPLPRTPRRQREVLWKDLFKMGLGTTTCSECWKKNGRLPWWSDVLKTMEICVCFATLVEAWDAYKGKLWLLDGWVVHHLCTAFNGFMMTAWLANHPNKTAK